MCLQEIFHVTILKTCKMNMFLQSPLMNTFLNNAEHRPHLYTGIDAPCESNLPHSEPQARLMVRCAPTNGKFAESCNGHESESLSE